MGLIPGLKIEELVEGTGLAADLGSIVSIIWKGTLNRGDEFGRGASTFRIGDRNIIAGVERGVIGMRVGGLRKIQVGPHLAYRDREIPGIPSNAVLNFEVEMVESMRSPE